MIYLVDPTANIQCTHRAGDASCTCFPTCTECGDWVDPREGHVCGADVVDPESEVDS
jgi:hypothetical protein